MKIKICSHVPVVKQWSMEGIVVNPTAIFLKTFYDIHGLNPDVEWLTPNILVLDDVDTIVDNLLKENVDILGLGVYVWNEKFQFQIAKKIKQINPDVLVVMGGPQLSVHRTDNNEDNIEDFFINFPYVDYVVYGDGERSFQQIIDFESGYLENKDNFVNIVEADSNSKRTIYPLEILDDVKYLSTSAFATNKKFVIDILDSIVERGIKKESLVWPLEFARGCMYSCSFCDWSQNLTKKVKRRTNNWREDVDFFIELDLKIRETDANFGMWKQDIEIFDYCLSKYNSEKNFQFLVSNTPKLKKEITEYIFTKSFQTYKEENFNLKFSLQDTNDEVLSAINRPGVPWSRIEQMVKHFQTHLPPDKFANIGVELILGMPGQTLDHMIENFVRLYYLKITNIMMYDYYYLKNSPASDYAYRKFWGVELMPVFLLNKDYGQTEFAYTNLNDFYYDIGHTDKYLHLLSNFQTIYKTKHMNEVEMLAAKLILSHFKSFIKAKPTKNISEIKYNEIELRRYLGKIKTHCLAFAQKQLNFHYPCITEHGYYIFGKWDDTKKIFDSKVYA